MCIRDRRGDSFGGLDLSLFRGSADSLSVSPGVNTVNFTGRWPSIYEIPQGTVQWGFGGGIGPAVVPGTYTVRLSMGDWSDEHSFEYAPNPAVNATAEEYQEQLAMAREVGEHAKRLYDELAVLRNVKMQANAIGAQLSQAGYGDDAQNAARELAQKLTAVEGELTQLEGEGGQDSLNFPGRLDQQYNGLYGAIAGSPAPVSGGAKERWADLEPQLQPYLDQIQEIYDTDLAAYNELIGEYGLKVLMKKEESADEADAME